MGTCLKIKIFRSVIIPGLSIVWFLSACAPDDSVPVPPPTGPSSWSIFSNDPNQAVFWENYNEDINSPFRKAWESTGLQDLLFGPNHIPASAWNSAITYIRATLKNSLESKTSYACYDRKAVDQFNRAINSNCVSSVDNLEELDQEKQQQINQCAGLFESGTKHWACNILYEEGGNPQAKTCCLGTTSSGFQAVPGKNGGSCSVGGQSCSVDSSKINGFSCSGWKSKTFDLENVDLRLKNLYGSEEVIGCMSPSTVVGASTEWGALGYGATCTEFDPSVTNVGDYISSPTYINPSLLYSNPYSNEEIAGLTKPLFSNPSRTNNPEYSLYTAWTDFCQVNPNFCKGPDGKARPGLAQLIGRMGPVSQSAYVALMTELNPSGYYNWQYDDAAGQIRCDGTQSKAIAIFCGGEELLKEVTVQQIFSGKPASRFAVYNNCPETIWVQMKPTKNTGNPDLCQGSLIVGNTDCLQKLTRGASYAYNTPQKGLQALNIWAKTGCEPGGFNCKTGETGNNNGSPGAYGSQPDAETKIEATIGCQLESSQCEKTGNGEALGQSSYFDVSFVDGYTHAARLQIVGATSEDGPICQTNPPPKVDLAQCPSRANLSFMKPK